MLFYSKYLFLKCYNCIKITDYAGKVMKSSWEHGNYFSTSRPRILRTTYVALAIKARKFPKASDCSKQDEGKGVLP